MKKPLIILGSCFAVLLALFSFTDPNNIPSIALIFPFVILFIVILTITITFFARHSSHSRRGKVIAGLCACVPIALLVMQSIGQLTFRDVITIGALFALAFFYISRTMSKA